jgi:ABC-type sugar transport system ATPase subunit
MVFQNYALYPHKTVSRNMAFALRAQRLPKADVERARAAGGRDPRTRRLDGAQARRAFRRTSGSASRWGGRSSATRPSFLFDEPLSNLDAELRSRLRSEIKKLHPEAPRDRRLRDATTRSRR